VLRNHAAGRSVDGPLPTLAAQGLHVGLAQPFLVPMYGERTGQVPRTHSVDEPVPTVPASGSGKFGVVEPFVISAGGANLRQPRSASDPLPTVMGSDRLAVVESFILPQHGGGVLRPDGQPLPTITTDGAIAVVEPFIIDANFGRGDNGHRVRSVDEPLGTLPASNRFGVAEPFLVPFYTERPEEKHARSRSVDEPLPTITGTGSGKLGVVEPFLTKYYGSGDGVSPATEPVPTVTTRDRFGLVEPFIVPNNTNNVPKSIDEPIPTVTGANRLALVQPSRRICLPLDAATQTFAFIARKGAGKTYTAGKLVEQLLHAGVQVVVLDTVGNWYGLRMSADGKGTGFDVPVLGGLRGDIPLEAAGGALIADIVVETGRSMVLDASQWSLADRQRFAAAFGERLWLRKKGEKHPAPVHLVIEESQLIVPQDVRGDTATMVGVYEEIIRLGRNYGIGVSMITQRPQSVNKEVLNQTECLFVGQVNGAQERDALKKWITHQGMDVHLVEELPTLKIGTFYVWSPQWLQPAAEGRDPPEGDVRRERDAEGRRQTRAPRAEAARPRRPAGAAEGDDREGEGGRPARAPEADRRAEAVSPRRRSCTSPRSRTSRSGPPRGTTS
jgi:hypothetical protein